MKKAISNGAEPGIPMDEIGGRVYDDYFQAHWGVLAMPEIDGRAVAFMNRGVDKATKAAIKAFKAKIKAGGVGVLDERFIHHATNPTGEPHTWAMALDVFDVETIREMLDSAVGESVRPDYFQVQREISHEVCQP